jgi:hypothetical protein
LVELAPHYYRENFRLLCETVEARYGDILTGDERSVLDCFRALSFDAQCLYVRLISRTGPWFREGRLDYPEIGALGTALDALLAADMAVAAAELDTEDLGQLFTRAELERDFAGYLGGQRFRTRDDLLAAIQALDLRADEILRALAENEDARIVAPLHREVIELLQLLFFGNRHQSLTDFVLSDLGVTRYFPYPLEREARLFENREALEEYLACAALGDAHRELLEQGSPEGLPSLARQVADLDITHGSSAVRFNRLCNNLARDLERLEEFELAAGLYERSARHPARERRARILERLGHWTRARALCERIAEDPWCEAEREAALRILQRVLRKLGSGPVSRRRDRFDEFALALPRAGEPVELLAAEHLERDWSAVHYVENGLMNTLFGLAFWEEIFLPLPGVFHHAYQGGPADLFEQDFRRARAAAIEQRLATLRGANLASLLGRAYRRYHTYYCHWTDWRRIGGDLVRAAGRIVPRAHLLAIFERLLFDPRENRSGFPDLIALGERPGDYCLIEVKGPGDALQDGQKRWLRYFAQQGIPARVARVSWSDD